MVNVSRFQLGLSLAPGLLVYSFVILFPLGFSIYFGFQNWTGGNYSFIGWANYFRLFADQHFWLSLRNTLIVTLYVAGGQLAIGLFISLVLVRDYVRAVPLHRSVVFFPVVLSPVVAGLIWKMIYSNRRGLLNLILESIGLEEMTQIWLGEPGLVLATVSVPVVWQYAGLYVVIFLGALMTIPKSVIESAVIDGASGFQQTFRIMIPMIYQTFKVAVMLAVAGGLKVFDHIIVMTGGGPGRASMTMSIFNYEVAFARNQYSYGAAGAIVIMLIILFITAGSSKVLGGKRYE